ncbi:hypothetical protein [Methylobacterium brachythecii]|uniref:TIGR02646 family protein n=1 Tax=Methylobacterium brachythecii TaxID=1176177 RepID=A0A7W6ALJ6_9HYPH|nr:hypothetical protein [Methylobacterium brachythecii]MBB3903954.1 hypothetical protein [Methylobacterium brachythecii]GLS42700.1 hypothetical protein GCM10007884_06850 [Methylobacterium brachythecii]
MGKAPRRQEHLRARREMIRYETAEAEEVGRRVDALVPNWRARAAKATQQMAAQQKFSGDGPSWSDVKPVYMRFQHNKCIFCERPLAGEVAGKVEQDVEHFRPKNALKPWPPKQPKGQPAPYVFGTGAAGAGYYWLAYELTNYAASCKPCNSTRKANYFPIASGNRGGAGQDVAALNAGEQPFLPYPLGTVDVDPETLIAFDGIVAKPIAADGPDHRRALVTIDFFGLNTREELWADRFRTISDLWTKLELIETSSDARRVETATRGVEDVLSDAAPQASCARSFYRLYKSDPIAAYDTYLVAERFWRSKLRPAES